MTGQHIHRARQLGEDVLSKIIDRQFVRPGSVP